MNLKCSRGSYAVAFHCGAFAGGGVTYARLLKNLAAILGHSLCQAINVPAQTPDQAGLHQTTFSVDFTM